MKLKYVIFDLDGTLLPMDYDKFVDAYANSMKKFMKPLGYCPDKLEKGIWKAITSTYENDGKATNEEIYHKSFVESYKDAPKNYQEHLMLYYDQCFDEVKYACQVDERAKETIDAIKALGIKMAVATTPVFPKIATKKRIEWTGIDPNEFEFFTTYEDHHFCKPSLNYYQEVMSKLNAKPEECIMVGNDATEDMVAQQLGMKVFLLTDCLLNEYNVDITNYPQGGFNELLNYIKENI